MVRTRSYIPRRGDVVWIDLIPKAGSKAGHEQAGHRTALIVSPQAYNAKVGLAVMCPIANRIKGYPFEVAIPTGLAVSGVVLADQVRSMDWRARNAELICSLPSSAVNEIRGKLRTLFE